MSNLRHSRAHTREALRRHKARMLYRRTLGTMRWPVEWATKCRDRTPCSCLMCRNHESRRERTVQATRLRERDAADLEATCHTSE